MAVPTQGEMLGVRGGEGALGCAPGRLVGRSGRPVGTCARRRHGRGLEGTRALSLRPCPQRREEPEAHSEVL